jgi:hypothetical protein
MFCQASRYERVFVQGSAGADLPGVSHGRFVASFRYRTLAIQESGMGGKSLKTE